MERFVLVVSLRNSVVVDIELQVSMSWKPVVFDENSIDLVRSKSWCVFEAESTFQKFDALT